MAIEMQVRDQTPMTDRSVGDVHFDDIVAARHLLARLITPTPLVTHPLLSQRLGAEVHVKLENTVPLGSFKLRGGLNLLASLTPQERARGLVTATRGNHGQSLASAALQHDVRCVVFVPEGNNPDKNAAISALGATVRAAGTDFDAAWEAALKYSEDTGLIAVHPSREPKLMAGYATVALEMLDQLTGLVYNALSPHTRLIGVQSAAAPALARAWHSGELREYPVGETLADGLAARTPSPDTLAILREVLDDLIEVSEAEIAAAIRGLAETVHQMAEGAGAAALAGAMHLRRRIAGERIGVVLSGGNITVAQLSQILHGELLPHAERAELLAAQLADMEYGARGT